MKKLLDKIDRIRQRGKVTLRVNKSSPFFRYNGNTFAVDSMGSPGIKCRVTLVIKGKKVHFTIHDVL